VEGKSNSVFVWREWKKLWQLALKSRYETGTTRIRAGESEKAPPSHTLSFSKCIKRFPLLHTHTFFSVLQPCYFMQAAEFRPYTKVDTEETGSPRTEIGNPGPSLPFRMAGQAAKNKKCKNRLSYWLKQHIITRWRLAWENRSTTSFLAKFRMFPELQIR
jgi:hypothetical protein